jgi:hypothetical protein
LLDVNRRLSALGVEEIDEQRLQVEIRLIAFALSAIEEAASLG